MLSDLLIEFGAVEAINLDGGGSTAMVIRNKLVNKPSDVGGERPVSDAILVFPR
jgi:exopolysaccharide biosynthesis protein